MGWICCENKKTQISNYITTKERNFIYEVKYNYPFFFVTLHEEQYEKYYISLKLLSAQGRVIKVENLHFENFPIKDPPTKSNVFYYKILIYDLERLKSRKPYIKSTKIPVLITELETLVSKNKTLLTLTELKLLIASIGLVLDSDPSEESETETDTSE